MQNAPLSNMRANQSRSPFAVEPQLAFAVLPPAGVEVDENPSESRAATRPVRPAAEFFAGMGLVRKGLERAGFGVVFANDNDPAKRELYADNFDDSDFVLGDVTDPKIVNGRAVPDITLATASFPCTDLSLAGNRAGLIGTDSGAFWGFARVLREMGARRPSAIMLENVPSLATSNSGEDLTKVLTELNAQGYVCDMVILDARWFVPQSRPRLFIVASRNKLSEPGDWTPSALRPAWMRAFVCAHPALRMQACELPMPQRTADTLNSVVERLPENHVRWWERERLERFIDSLSAIQSRRLRRMQTSPTLGWATAYRRTRGGVATWEIRDDQIAGCLRTARGGSSKQALVEAGGGDVRVRWMTPLEYARLQGAGDLTLSTSRENRALFGLGDAVCVPAVAWLAANYLRPLVDGEMTDSPAFAHS